ncbi:pyridoxal phosphate-dependent aminotransferase [Tropicibacter naphthalenivorans]|uniref:Histidinol-phosphate aminotransferase 2 n=1 Tax=Tropicibacter naphthalenivorans TaxID=441103 RepID=A0A0P1GI81_9RHOB|nr:pyridoxal phosphate-dependent aminotransferase [Tropicibacter naphthalenivorans]CUH81475.1 Histidinol-phosphate aminotransferase 2 [Tropicibacter naphthalenivorans]SMD00250.1 histidinol-phosphate aminotransferase [Tropicibacter naphthalenivorans]
MTGPRYPALIKALPETVPFVGPEVQERAQGFPFKARLGANESMFGPSPFAVAAMQDEIAEIWKYADSAHLDLKGALAARNACTPQNILIGEGIDGLLGYTVRLLVDQGDAVVTSDGAYPTFNYHVAGFGGVLHKVPYKDDREDILALFDKAAEVDAKIVYLANPDNPMGTWYDGKTIEAALDRLPEGCVFALDEAYIEFAPQGTAPKIDPQDPRVLRFRTFSKAYGMAGARIGYVLGAAETIKAFDKIRNHFGMNRPAMAGALAALADDAWLTEVLRLVDAARKDIARIAKDNGLTTLPSATNFVAVDCGQDGDFARKVLAALLAQGIFVRMPFVAPQDRCIRISAGRPEDMALLAEALPKALETARNS